MSFPGALVAALVISALPAPAAAGTPTELDADALWVWSWEGSGSLTDFTVAAGFERVYLYAQGGFGPHVRAAIADLGAAGVAVEALGGERRWATVRRGGMIGFVRSARRYQRRAPADARLAGVHVDVEPYALRAWDRHPRRVRREYLAALRAARRAAGPLPLAADIPFWFDGIRLGGMSLAAAAIRATDAVTVMAYRDSADRVIDLAEREVRIAGRHGSRATVGVETGDHDPPSITFFEEGRAALAAALAAIDARLGARPGYGGTAVHHYGSLAGLKP
ncbi:MAG: hypothetical protein KJ006_12550 [Thermoleophilia bacterium]|nr:hypothetical protein [Thermoleophilia bacterium]